MSSNTTRRKVQLELKPTALEKPSFWKIEGSRYRRKEQPASLSRANLFQEALPPDYPENGRFALKQIEVLRPGVYKGIPFTPEMMGEIVNLFTPADPPPVQADHSQSALDTHGRILDVMLDESLPGGPRVVALALFLGEYAVERVLDGRWNKFSAGLWLNPTWLEHLAVTPFPACPTAAMLARDGKAPSSTGSRAGEAARLRAELSELRRDFAAYKGERPVDKSGRTAAELAADKKMLMGYAGIKV